MKWLLRTVVAVAIVIAAVMAYVIQRYNMPPTIQLINASGGPISQVVIRLGSVKAPIGRTLRNGEMIETVIPFRGSETATAVRWVDASGKGHDCIADDYLEGRGNYHSTVVVTSDKLVAAWRGAEL